MSEKVRRPRTMFCERVRSANFLHWPQSSLWQRRSSVGVHCIHVSRQAKAGAWRINSGDGPRRCYSEGRACRTRITPRRRRCDSGADISSAFLIRWQICAPLSCIVIEVVNLGFCSFARPGCLGDGKLLLAPQMINASWVGRPLVTFLDIDKRILHNP